MMQDGHSSYHCQLVSVALNVSEWQIPESQDQSGALHCTDMPIMDSE